VLATLPRESPDGQSLIRTAARAQYEARLLLAKAEQVLSSVGATHDLVSRTRNARLAAAARRRRVRDEPVRDLVESHRPLAQRIAAGFASRGQPLEDLEQVAYLGLVTAARRFDPSRGVRFATFARVTVTGELKKYFRDHSWLVRVPRSVQELYLVVRPAVEELTQSLGRAPTIAEIAQQIGADEEAVVEALDAAGSLHADSLDRPRYEDDDEQRAYEPSWSDEGFARVDERSWLVPALASLPPRERRILELRFLEGLPQSAIAERVGISQMHVSRLLARTLATLREHAPDA
jgi:RNA polymerase sigma-B factor